MAKTAKTETEISVMEVNRGILDFYIVGTSPVILYRMSQKAMQELLMPKGKKSAVEKASTLKHNPMDEFRSSPYVSSDDTSATYLQILATAFKGSMKYAALRTPGLKKAEIASLVWVVGERVEIYGVPQLFMSIVRSADMNRTPDVRTRCIVPKWACKLSVSFIKPQLRDSGIANLLASAGLVSGVGDWRPEKGSGTYGQFRLASADDAEFASIVKTGGRKAQVAAMAEPECYDDETSELLSWFDVESKRRGFKVAS